MYVRCSRDHAAIKGNVLISGVVSFIHVHLSGTMHSVPFKGCILISGELYYKRRSTVTVKHPNDEHTCTMYTHVRICAYVFITSCS